MATLDDVARIAAATVSNVPSERAPVRETTRLRVLTAFFLSSFLDLLFQNKVYSFQKKKHK